MDWFKKALASFTDFSGRSQRAEYWYFVLFYTLIYFGAMLVDYLLGWYSQESEIGLLSGLISLALLIPYLAVSVRRLHDTGRTGWWLLMLFIPILGLVVLLYFFTQDSMPRDNEYGPNPKDIRTAVQ